MENVRTDLEYGKGLLKSKLLSLMPTPGNRPTPIPGLTLYRRDTDFLPWRNDRSSGATHFFSNSLTEQQIFCSSVPFVPRIPRKLMLLPSPHDIGMACLYVPSAGLFALRLR